MEEKKLCRSSEKMLAGVCGGLAQYFGIDPVIVRIIFVVLALPGVGTGLLIYILMWIIMPDCQTDAVPPAQ
ncbi:MAG: PspC domain-containing protein [Anaerolineae bacterium]|nr:PspC domain-containing protein [Anaerolineae bacterium]